MNDLPNISHIYRGLIFRSRAFASFREREELYTIYSDLKQHISSNDIVLDPMSGYGGGMQFFGKQGFETVNIEINPPAYYWQILINPQNTQEILRVIGNIQRVEFPKLDAPFSLTDNLFSDIAIIHIKTLYEMICSCSNQNQKLAVAILLPFVSRFANYLKSSANLTHFKEGGLCTYTGWEEEFRLYLAVISERLARDFPCYKELKHTNILSDIMKVELSDRYSFFVTSPPYPNYRDYSKLFKIENWVLDNIIFNVPTNFNMMIGSNNVSGKSYGEIHSDKANKFLSDLLEKSKQLKKKSKRDVETYYHPYFAQYFYNMQEAYYKLNTMLSNNAMGYIVVNDNITRDIIVPVGASICDIFQNMGYDTEYFNISQISHYGNIGKEAKRINSHHTRHILKVWRK